jgi:hypothetical protein
MVSSNHKSYFHRRGGVHSLIYNRRKTIDVCVCVRVVFNE